MASFFSCTFNSEIPGNFQLKKVYFGLITTAERHEHFDEFIADFQGKIDNNFVILQQKTPTNIGTSI